MSGDFWSRRRAGVAAEAEGEARAEAEADAARATEALEADLGACDEAGVLAARGLAAPETLETPEALRAFLREALPARLRARAFRRMWRLNPTLANLDGLVDYGGDFTDAALRVEAIQTVYQVGKGMLTAFAPDPEPDPDAEAEVEEAPEVDPDAAPEAETDAPEPQPALVAAAPVDASFAEPAADLQDAPAAAAPRRMTFRFTPEARSA